MTDKSQALIDELVALCTNHSRKLITDRQAGIDRAKRKLKAYIEGLKKVGEVQE